MNVILELSSPDSLDEYRTEAVAVSSYVLYKPLGSACFNRIIFCHWCLVLEYAGMVA